METILAKNCKIDFIDKKDADNFIDENHTQGRAKIKTVNVGMKFNNSLVAVAQFCYPQDQTMKKKYSRELTRLSFKKDFQIIDGTSCLIKFYIKKRNPPDIFINQDIVGVAGEFYEECGFKTCENGYAWFNDNIYFYIYKITADGSDKYYYGVHQVNQSEPDVDFCVNDGYWGSGRSKLFLHWRKKYKNLLKKEIISIHRRKSEAYKAEEKIIGNLWFTDPRCLNFTSGGVSGGLSTESSLTSVKNCKEHGIVKHIGEKCYSCINNNYHHAVCEVHGKTKFQKDSCLKCRAKKLFSTKLCEIHGESTFRKDKCEKCKNEKMISEEECSIHGLVKHRGGRCSSCTAAKSVNLRFCETHGETKFQGEECFSCRNSTRIITKTCKAHGKTKFIGDKCRKCVSGTAVSYKECSKHGKTKHLGSKCAMCQAKKAINIKNCSVHGETKFQGDKCFKCQSSKLYSVKTCVKHGKVKFRGSSCQLCIGEKVRHARSHKVDKVDDCEYCIKV